MTLCSCCIHFQIAQSTSILLGIELGASCTLSKHSTNWVSSHPIDMCDPKCFEFQNEVVENFLAFGIDGGSQMQIPVSASVLLGDMKPLWVKVVALLFPLPFGLPLPPPTLELEPRASCMLSRSKHSTTELHPVSFFLLSSSFPATASFMLSGLFFFFFSSLSRVNLTYVSKSEAALSENSCHVLSTFSESKAHQLIHKQPCRQGESLCWPYFTGSRPPA